MKNMRKRGAVYGVIGLMLCLAVYLNWNYFQTPVELTVADEAVESSTSDKSESYGALTEVSAAQNGEQKEEAKTTAATAEEDYFAQARLTRQNARDAALAELKETVSGDNATEQARTEASEQISKLAANAVAEARIESLIQAKGYNEAVVYISDSAISVVVASPEGGLTSADTAKIADVVLSETGADAPKLRISEAGAQATTTENKEDAQ